MDLRILFLLGALHGSPAGASGFVYEGSLDEFGQPAHGHYDLRLRLYRDPAGGKPLGEPIAFEAVMIDRGRFRVQFEADPGVDQLAYVEVEVRASGEPAFSAIPGREKAVAAPLIGQCWSAIGDIGSTPGTNFLGTIDAQALVLRTHNVQSLRLEPSAQLSSGLPITANVVAGSSVNSAGAGVRGGAVLGGGSPVGADPDQGLEGPNRVMSHYAVVAGGAGNQAGPDAGGPNAGAFSFVGGGRDNLASGTDSVIVGGVSNQATVASAVVGGGNGNIASGPASVIIGGLDNIAGSSRSVVIGGINNISDSINGIVAGNASEVLGSTALAVGNANCAGGDFSVALGAGAATRPDNTSTAAGGCVGIANSGDANGDEGSFVWADTQGAFVSTGSNQFLVRAQGGVGINTNAPTGNALRVNGIVRVDTLGAAGSTTLCRNANNQIAGCSSSARYKQDIADLDLELGLRAAERLHAVQFRWREGGADDLGFVAEEVAQIDERLVTRSDSGEIEGVRYDRVSAVLTVAVQELLEREREQQRELDELRAEVATIREMLAPASAGR